MKKSLIAAVLAVATTTASAGFTFFGSVDYDNAAGHAGGMKSMTEGHLGAAVSTKFGTFDASVAGARLHSVGTDEALGFELGYTNGLALGPVSLKGRGAVGRMNQVDTRGVLGYGGNTKYYSLAVEAGLPVTQAVTAFVGYRHRNGLEADTPSTQNRWTAGADFKVSPDMSLRLGAAHTRQEGEVFNGLTTAIHFKF